MKRGFIKLIYKLMSLVGSFTLVIMLAVITGVVGYLLAINITLFASIALIKFLGIDIALSYSVIFTIIIVSGILRGILRYVEQYNNHYMAFKILGIVRNKLFKALAKLEQKKLDDLNKGVLISILQADIETLEVFYAHTISPLLIAIIVSLIMFITLSITTSIYLGLIALLSYIIIGGIIPVIFYKSNKKFGKKYRSELGQFENFYLDSIYGGYEIVSQNKQSDMVNELNIRAKNITNLHDKLNKKNNLFSNITTSIIILLNLIIIIVGYLLFNNNLIESPYIILAYVILTSSFGPVLALANLPNNLTMSFSAGNRVLDIIEEDNEIIDGKENLDFNNLEFKNVSFKYDDKEILNNCNIKINKNEIIGILGPSGIGKSTILKLMMRFYDVSSGEVLINNKDIKEYSYDSLYDNINLFSQSTYLFRDTILNNLLIAKPNASIDEVKKACSNAGILNYIEGLKEGFNTKISDLKDNISEGEKQRLGLARVFLRKPKLLLLDEATSNVDAINEGVILNAIKAYQEDMTIIIISHRKSTLNICSKVYGLEGGKLCLV